MVSDIRGIIGEVDTGSLRASVHALEGLRHGSADQLALEEKGCFVKEALRSFDLPVESRPVSFRGRAYRNIIATVEGEDSGAAWLLAGAHYDGPLGSPGADDNASGVAVLLEVARLLGGQRPSRTIQLAAFTLEERQLYDIGILTGSRRFVKEERRLGRCYAGALILECVGYTSSSWQSRAVSRLAGITVPETADFLAVIANRESQPLMASFCCAAAEFVPELPLVPYAVPLSGYLIPQTRFSDHAPFWDAGYPALMLTDTAMFRNPHYHTGRDTSDTLDYGFMAAVARAVTAALLSLGGGAGGSPSFTAGSADRSKRRSFSGGPG
jgi:Zn-dependent M28 family amino/carboxypeptidase